MNDLLSDIKTGVKMPEGVAGWEELEKRWAIFRGRIDSVRTAQVEIGLYLIELRRITPRGVWGQRLAQYGIRGHTHTRAMKVAGMHLGLSREQMAEAMCVSVERLRGFKDPEPVHEPDSPRQSGAKSSGSGRTGEALVLDETPCAGPEEIAALNRMYGIEEEDGVDVTVTVDAQGLGTTAPAAALAGEPPVARDQAVAGRIGPAELGRARRPEAAGQMNLLSVWMELESEVAGAAERGHGEKARAIVARHMAEIRKELAELGEAA